MNEGRVLTNLPHHSLMGPAGEEVTAWVGFALCFDRLSTVLSVAVVTAVPSRAVLLLSNRIDTQPVEVVSPEAIIFRDVSAGGLRKGCIRAAHPLPPANPQG